ncbi:MAG: hypothetical protein WBN92_16595 [Terriglobia bacterium]
MTRMIRKQIYIAPEQDHRLKKIAREMRTTEASIIRQGLDRLFTVGVHSIQDLDIWKHELSFIKKRARARIPSQKRAWRREEVHERGSFC